MRNSGSFTTWAEPEPKRRSFRYAYPAHSLQELVLPQTNGTDGKCLLRRGAPWVTSSQPTIHQEPQTREPQIHEKNSGFRKISSILFDVEKFSEFNGTIILQIPANIARCRLILSAVRPSRNIGACRQCSAVFDGQANAWPWLGRWPCSVFTQKQVFGPCTAKSQPIWIKFCRHLLFYGIHLWADLLLLLLTMY